VAQTDLFPTEAWDAIGEYTARMGQPPVPRACSTCGALMWWGYTRNQRRNPYDFVDGNFTNISHFSTCPDRKLHSRR